MLFSGPNAQGKTNALEAFWTLASLRPLRSLRLPEAIGWGGSEAELFAEVEGESGRRQLRLRLGPQGRELELDGARVTDLGDWFDALRAVAFCPQDGVIIEGDPSLRRAWLDRAAFLVAPAHLEVVRAYKRALDQKLALLRAPPVDPLLLKAVEGPLVHLGARLADRRARVLAELLPHLRQVHADLAGSGELTLRYRTSAAGEDEASRVERLVEALRSAGPRELERRQALVGPHRDEVEVLLDGRPLRQVGSRGQVRTAVLALKLAELKGAGARGFTPLFLLDDLSSELDRQRIKRLVGLLEALGTQTVVTTTEADLLPPVAARLQVQVQAGQMRPQP